MDDFDYSVIKVVDIDYLRRKAERARTLVALVMPACIELGEILIEVRDRIPHGYFGPYCLEALHIDRRRAQILMNLAKLAKTHGREQVEKLSPTAAQHIAAPSAPTSVVAAVLDSVAAGNIPTAAAVKNLIRDTGIETQPATAPGLEDEIEALTDLLLDALDASGLARLNAFLSGASPDAIQNLCRSLEASAPIAAAAQDSPINQWMLTS